jgi:uncharacterized phage protein gp47/JayE
MSDSRDVIQARLLASIDNSYNKSEGEFMYDAEKPVSIELESTYTTLSGMPDKRFADTATGKNLERICKEKGIFRKITTQSSGVVTITGVVGSPITSGQLVASDSLNFQFTETTTVPSSGSINVNVQCLTYGVIGNVPIGAIKYFPKTLTGLTGVTNVSAFSNGEDEESDTSLRNRYYVKVNSSVTTANKEAFKSWALSVANVGNAKVIPIWNGAGSVKVLIINSLMKGADPTLVKSVQDYIDPNMNGDGSGAMPLCGAICTIASATEKAINISVTIQTTLDNNTAQSKIEDAIAEYLQSIAFNQNYVSYQMVGTKILNIPYITDCSNLTINSASSNVNLVDDEVAVLGAITIG